MQPFLLALKRVMRQPSFVVAFVVLLVAAVGLNAATQFLKLHFKKLSVPLASPLDTIPLELGDWYCVSKDELTDEMVQELATEKFVFRDYVNLHLLGLTKDSPEIRQFEGRSAKDRRCPCCHHADAAADRNGLGASAQCQQHTERSGFASRPTT